MNKQQLANKIWESANNMRSKIEANEYKDYILGFIFYKYLSEKEEEILKSEGYDDESLKTLIEDDTQAVVHCQTKLGYFIPYEFLFSTWIKKGSDFDVSNVRDALNSFNRNIGENHKRVFDKIFDTLQQGLSKLGDNTASQTKAISKLLSLIRDIPMDGKQGYDVLGFVYEYLIGKFASTYTGKKAGEFYTPYEVSLLMSEIVAYHLKGRDAIEIYDPTSGSGSLLINIGKSVSKYLSDKNSIKYYAQELINSTYNLTRMNLVMRNILPSNIITRNGDTLEDDWPFFVDGNKEKTYNPLFVDAVVSNPPYSQKWDTTDKEVDARFAEYGIAPKSYADYAFLLHDLYHLKGDGIMTIVLPHGVLFRGGDEEKIRTNLIENNNIDTIIGLPSNIFFNTGIPTIIMVLKKKKDNDDVLIIDASKGFEKVDKKNRLRACDIKKIVDVYKERKSYKKYSAVVTRQQIRDNGYNLNIPRYVDTNEKKETFDLYSLLRGGIPQHELNDFNLFWNAFPSLKNKLFKKRDDLFFHPLSDEIKSIVKNNADVKSFIKGYSDKFDGFDIYLKDLIIENVLSVNLLNSEQVITDKIFKKIEDITLVDKYNVYQLFDDMWQKIAVDIEMIQTEGFDTCKKVDPNMVIKTKDNKEVEVQDGWKGRIIPFELIYKTKLKDKYTSLENKKSKKETITSEISFILDEITEEEKLSNPDLFNDDNTKFVNNNILKFVKKINKSKEKADDFTQKIIKASSLIEEEKQLNKEIKEENVILLTETKKVIENLSYEEIKDLLYLKWINPTLEAINKVTEIIISDFSSKISKLCEKYKVTASEIDDEITKEEQELIKLISDLDAEDESDKKGLQDLVQMLGGGKYV